jgi:hypothetical protein
MSLVVGALEGITAVFASVFFKPFGASDPDALSLAFAAAGAALGGGFGITLTVGAMDPDVPTLALAAMGISVTVGARDTPVVVTEAREGAADGAITSVIILFKSFPNPRRALTAGPSTEAETVS